MNIQILFWKEKKHCTTCPLANQLSCKKTLFWKKKTSKFESWASWLKPHQHPLANQLSYSYLFGK